MEPPSRMLTTACPAPQSKAPGEVQFPGGMIDLARGRVCYADGEAAEFSGREMELLKYLVANAGRIVTREELLVKVWQMNSHCIITRTIDMHVAKVRDKLRDDAQHPKVLLTIRGEGYLFLTTPRTANNIHRMDHESLGTVPALAMCG